MLLEGMAKAVAALGGSMAKGTQGFASMNPSKVRQIASLGGRAAHKKGTAHEFTTEEARLAGRKGGAARQDQRKKKQAQSGI